MEGVTKFSGDVDGFVGWVELARPTTTLHTPGGSRKLDPPYTIIARKFGYTRIFHIFSVDKPVVSFRIN